MTHALRWLWTGFEPNEGTVGCGGQIPAAAKLQDARE